MPPPTTRQTDSFAAVCRLWQVRLESGWEPPEGGSFPWPQVRRSLAALVVPCPLSSGSAGDGSKQLALICAGNTPLLAWPAMLFSLRHGVNLSVKLSQHEKLWPRLLKESIAEVSAEAAQRITLCDWPGQDSRTEELIRSSDAVIAYGSDETIARLRQLAGAKPFLGFGHALSVGVVATEAGGVHWHGFARDILTFDQQGCLSPQALFAENPDSGIAELTAALTSTAQELEIPARADMGQAMRVRVCQSLAALQGAEVIADPGLRWTVVVHASPRPLELLDCPGLVQILRLHAVSDFGELLGPARGRLSAVGIAGEASGALRTAVEAEGASYICRAGEMQTPPLDWRNGGVDLDAWIGALA